MDEFENRLKCSFNYSYFQIKTAIKQISYFKIILFIISQQKGLNKGSNDVCE